MYQGFMRVTRSIVKHTHMSFGDPTDGLSVSALLRRPCCSALMQDSSVVLAELVAVDRAVAAQDLVGDEDRAVVGGVRGAG